MARTNRYGLTTAELAKFREPCPGCGSTRTYQVGTALGYEGCHDCNRTWGWRDKRGQAIGRRKYDELVRDERAR